MELNKQEKIALENLSKLLQSNNIAEICFHYFLGKGFTKLDEIVKQLPEPLKKEINKRLNL